MSTYEVNDQVRIKSSKELIRLRELGHDITDEMIEAGGKIVTILYVVPSYLWIKPAILEYRVEEEPEWTWYENLLEPIE